MISQKFLKKWVATFCIIYSPISALKKIEIYVQLVCIDINVFQRTNPTEQKIKNS